jgi:aminobenzoyl-glutamate utilization protein B
MNVDPIASDFIQSHDAELIALSQAIFDHPETADQEQVSVALLTAYLDRQGFSTTIQEGYPTAFRSTWGSGRPVIGFLAEYDALPGLDQRPVPRRDGDPAKNGHGCGHNLLGVGAVAAAVAVKESLARTNGQGTIVLYGCPSEEILEGKIVMAKAGAFRELDVALSWHPSDCNQTGEFSYQALDSIQFAFSGRTAHAASSPHLGRSALDACELMNVGVNYLREHVTEDVRIHYTYVHAGEKPNVVPDFAKTWYFVRGRCRSHVDETTARVMDIAAGAVLMTGTTFHPEFLVRGYETLVNFGLSALIYQVMQEIGAPGFSEAEKAFARELSEADRTLGLTGAIKEDIVPMRSEVLFRMASSDLSDVSQIVPTGHFTTVCAPQDTPWHHWTFTASAGMSIGQKGMLYSARILAETACRLIADPDLLQEVQREFKDTAKGWWT